MKSNINRIAVDLDSETANKLRMYCVINNLTLKEALTQLIQEHLK